jgi:hypothetical protein
MEHVSTTPDTAKTVKLREQVTLAGHCITAANCQEWSASNNSLAGDVFVIHRTILVSHRSRILFYPVEPYPVICRHLT